MKSRPRALRSAGARACALLVMALTGAVANADDAKPYWSLTSGQLTVISNSSAQRCERLAASMLRFEQALSELAGSDLFPRPLLFVSLDRADAKSTMLSAADRELLRRNRAVIIHSKYLPGADFDVLAIADLGNHEPLQSVLFMYARGRLSEGAMQAHPEWFRVGVSSLLHGVVLKPDGAVLLNRDPTLGAVSEQEQRPTHRIDLTALLTAAPGASAPEFAAFAAQAHAWATFGLLTTDERRKQYHELARSMQPGVEPDAAMLKAFGKSLAEISAELDQSRWRKDVRFRLPPPTARSVLPAAKPIAPAEMAAPMAILAERAQRTQM